jgi:hypothetical protein
MSEGISITLSQESPVFFDDTQQTFCFSCPHCDGSVQVEKNQVNCTIFRHGYFFVKDAKGNIILTSQLGQHTCKEQCDMFVEKGMIVGCGKPFRMVHDSCKDGIYKIVKCDYI